MRLRVFLLQDNLVFQTRGPRRFRVRNDTEAREMLKDRFIQLVPDIDPRTFFAQGQSAGPWRAATSAFSKVRTAWNTVIFPNSTAEFKERLQKNTGGAGYTIPNEGRIEKPLYSYITL